jgi:hypothetical protein
MKISSKFQLLCQLICIVAVTVYANNTSHHSSLNDTKSSSHNDAGTKPSNSSQDILDTAVHPHGICLNNEICHHSGRCVVVEHHHKSVNECHCTQGYKGVNCKETCSLHCKNGGHCKPPTHDVQNLRLLTNESSSSSDDKCICPSGYTGDLCEKTVHKQTNNNDTKHPSSNAAPEVTPNVSGAALSTVSTIHQSKATTNVGSKIGILVAVVLIAALAFGFYRRRKAARAAAITASENNPQKFVDKNDTYNDSEFDIDEETIDDDKWNTTTELS